MAGIANLEVAGFRDRILRFKTSYVEDWRLWTSVLHDEANVAPELGRVLRRWQACRPNRMRRPQVEAKHDPPYLEDLIADANPSVVSLLDFDVRILASFTPYAERALERLWSIFEELSHHGRARSGLAGAVGISKAVMLLTEGRVGPAFDSTVTAELNIPTPGNARGWIQSLLVVSKDVQAFELANRCTLQAAAPPTFADLKSGRIYDMALGPGST
jgi:hypothetical protein